MKKAKTLMANEQDVFLEFLNKLQFEHFLLLQKKY